MISIIIVTYNSSAHIPRCLESFEDSGAEIVVLDNASVDGTAALVRRLFPEVKLIAASRNLGFAAGANLAVRNCSGTVLLFVNPDVVCQSPLAGLEEALESSPQTVAVAPRLVDAEGRPQVGFNVRRLPTPAALLFEILALNRCFPNNPVNREYRCLDFDYRQPAEIEQPAAACLLVRRRSFEDCGGFDERFYPLWFEDVDLCLRLRRQGGKILYLPNFTFQHAGGHSLDSITFSERQVYWYRNLLYYVSKQFPWMIGVALRAALFCGVGLRMAAELPGLFRSLQPGAHHRGERIGAYVKAAKLAFMGWR